MRSFWVPIGLRALGIFVVGFGLVTGVRHLIAQAEHHTSHDAVDNAMEATRNAVAASENAAAASANAAEAARVARGLDRLARIPGMAGLTKVVAAAAAEIANQPFVLDGQRLGSIQQLVLKRPAQDAPLTFHVTVQLAPGAAAADCDVTAVDAAHFDVDKGFRCAAGEALVKAGDVRFEPAGVTRAIMVTAQQAKDLASGEPVDLDVSLDGQGRIAVRKDGKEQVRIVSGADGGTVVVSKDNGETVRIDATGRRMSVSVDSARR